MAIFVELSKQELRRIADAFSLGDVTEVRFVPQGSINTNALLSTSSGRFFLRHTTVRSANDLGFEAALLDHLHGARFPAPRMLRAEGGAPFLELDSGRACVFNYLWGEELAAQAVTPEHCEELGAELAKLHRATRSFPRQRENPYGAEVVSGWLDELEAHETMGAVARELRDALSEARRAPVGLVERAIIHADLFRDNVKWIGAKVASFFDFEMACTDDLVLDLAITLNAWCFDDAYHPERAGALVRGYQSERPLSENERSAFHARALFGAVRFTTSRLRDFELSALPPERLARKSYQSYLSRVRALRALGPERFRQVLGL